jgi:hypothetical protein
VCLLRGTFYILRSAHTVYLCVLCGSQNKQRLFHCTALTDWLVFITETECVYCAVRTGSSNTIAGQHPFHPRAALVSRHFCYQSDVFILTFLFVLFLLEGRAGEAWESFNVVIPSQIVSIFCLEVSSQARQKEDFCVTT